MNSRNYKYALLLVAAVAITATGAMSQAYAQQVLTDGMGGYVKRTSGIYTGNPNECWVDNGDGGMLLHVMVDTGDTAWMLTATSLVLFMSPQV